MDSSNSNQDSRPAAKFDRLELLHALDSVNSDSRFAGFMPLESCDPAIFVQDVGRVNVPLSEAQAKQIATKSHQAPYGKGSETIVDVSVRNTWELNPDQFEITAPDWQHFLDLVLTRVREELNIRSPISAELYKMLLYEKGAMFKAHTDTEKIPRMFGTLVISLPSSHEGGDVAVSHRGRSYTYQTSRCDMACAFWFSDVSHEVFPVKSGNRWVLTYNLAIDPSVEVPSADDRLDHWELRRVLQLWSQEVNSCLIKPSPLYYVLDHKYTEANISYEGLKPPDLDIVKFLREICPQLDFDLFLATLEKEETGMVEDSGFNPSHRSRYRHFNEEEWDGGIYHPLEEIDEEYYSSKYIFDLGGNKLAEDVHLESCNILPENSFEDHPDQEDYEEYMGNSGPSATHWYRISALVIIPCRATASLFSGCGGSIVTPWQEIREDIQALCTYFITRRVEYPRRSDAQLYEFIKRTCFSTSWRYDGEILTGNNLLQVLQTSILAEEPKLLDLILDKNKAQVPGDFFKWIREEHDNSRVSTERFKKVFLHALRTQATLSQQYQALLAVEGEGEPTDEVRDVISLAVNEHMRFRVKDSVLFEEDGPALLDLSLYYHDFSYLKETVLPIIEKRSSWTAFVLGFVRALYQSMECQQIPQDRAQPVYEHLARLALRGIKLASLTSVDTPLLERVQESRQQDGSMKQYVTYDSMLKFVSTLVALKLEEHLELLAEKLGSQAEEVDGEEFNELWIPLLQMLLPVLEQQEISPPGRHWMRMYQALLKAYLKNYVEEKPLKLPLSRQRVTCSCGDCQMSLNPFLVSPNDRVGRFTMGDKRRQHLINKLYQTNIDFKARIDRSGRTYTLIVTKTTKHYDAMIDSWWDRRYLAENQLEAFNQELLKSILDDQFDEIMSMKFLEHQEQPATSSSSLSSSQHPQAHLENIVGDPADQLRQLNAEIARLADAPLPNPSPMPPPTSAPTPSYPYSGATASTSRPAPRESMAEVGRRISESTPHRTNQGTPLSLARRSPSSSANPAGSSNTPSRPTQMILNPIPGAKRKYIEVIDLTDDD
ncbi:hypothetical protein F5Y13DRAFT_199850 [Hypoxylon sp. FL1857]|nr:hypothetical protein F5Y13DRAFT_199850 [Hypoxylon sp. FL1857]